MSGVVGAFVVVLFLGNIGVTLCKKEDRTGRWRRHWLDCCRGIGAGLLVGVVCMDDRRMENFSGGLEFHIAIWRAGRGNQIKFCVCVCGEGGAWFAIGGRGILDERLPVGAHSR